MSATLRSVGSRQTAGRLLCSVLAATVPVLGAAQGVPTALNWGADDGARVAWLATNGMRVDRSQVTIWAPKDSLAPAWLEALADTLDRGITRMRRLMKAPAPYQRLGNGRITYYVSPGRFVSHASGRGAVFIPVSRVREGLAPWLHEAAHELLAPPPPYYFPEFADSLEGIRASGRSSLWFFEGMADVVAQTVAPAIGLHEGDVFSIGGLARADSTCRARTREVPGGDRLLAQVGRQGRPEALFTTERATVAPMFYACAQSLARHLVDHIGVESAAELMPHTIKEDWNAALEARIGYPLERFRTHWLERIGLAVADSSEDLRAWRQILDDLQASFMTRNGALFARHFAPDGDFMQAFGRYRGTKRGTQDFMEWFLGGQTAAFVSREVGTRTRRVTRDVAFVEAEFEGEGIRNADGSMQPPRRGQMMLVLRRDPEGWRVTSYRYLDIHATTLR